MLAAAAFAFLLVQEYTDQDRFGKTPEQVLAMGRTKWHEWYTHESRGGMSTTGETFAEMIYADAVGKENKELLMVAKGPRIAIIIELDQGFGRTIDNCTSAGMALTGGGTMWRPISAGAEATRQETVHDLIWPKDKQPAATQAQVWKSWTKALKSVKDNKSDIESYSISDLSYDKAVKNLYTVNSDFNAAVTRIKDQDAKSKARVFAFYDDMLKMVSLGAE